MPALIGNDVSQQDAGQHCTSNAQFVQAWYVDFAMHHLVNVNQVGDCSIYSRYFLHTQGVFAVMRPLFYSTFLACLRLWLKHTGLSVRCVHRAGWACLDSDKLGVWVEKALDEQLL